MRFGTFGLSYSYCYDEALTTISPHGSVNRSICDLSAVYTCPACVPRPVKSHRGARSARSTTTPCSCVSMTRFFASFTARTGVSNAVLCFGFDADARPCQPLSACHASALRCQSSSPVVSCVPRFFGSGAERSQGVRYVDSKSVLDRENGE